MAALDAAERKGNLPELLNAMHAYLQENEPNSKTDGSTLKAHGPVSSRSNWQRPDEESSEQMVLHRAIFISHAYSDRGVAELLWHALNLAGVSDQEIFYSSARATGIPTGTSLLQDLRTALTDARLVVELVSTTYLQRPMCVMEFGAAWAMEKQTFPIVIPPLSRNEARENLGNVIMDQLLEQDDVESMLEDLHGAVGMATGSMPTMGQWNKATKHIKSGLPAVLASPTPALTSTSSMQPSGLLAVPARAIKSAKSEGSTPKPRSGKTSVAAAPEPAPDLLEGATTRLRDALRPLDRATRRILLHWSTWREPYTDLEYEELRDAELAREIEFSDTYEGWIPREAHRKVLAALEAAQRWSTAMQESDEDEADQYLEDNDLNELDPQSHDVWQKLDLL